MHFWMRYWTVCALALGAATVVVAAAPAATDPYAPYVTPQGCRITPPPGWQRLGSSGLGPVTIFSGPPHDHFAPNVIFATAPPPAGVARTPAAVFSWLQAQLSTAYPKQFAHYALLSEGRVMVASGPAMQLTATYQAAARGGKPPRVVRVHQVYVLKHGLFYVFTLTSLPGDFARDDAQFADMLHHVYWTD